MKAIAILFALAACSRSTPQVSPGWDAVSHVTSRVRRCFDAHEAMLDPATSLHPLQDELVLASPECWEPVGSWSCGAAIEASSCRCLAAWHSWAVCSLAVSELNWDRKEARRPR